MDVEHLYRQKEPGKWYDWMIAISGPLFFLGMYIWVVVRNGN